MGQVCSSWSIAWSLATIAALSAPTTWAADVVSWRAPAWDDYLAHGPTEGYLPEFGYAGYHRGKDEPPRAKVSVRVTDFGAKPDDELDDTAAIQAAIHAVEARGGGVVELPAGRFVLNAGSDPAAYNLKITKSGVVLRGAGSGPEGTVLHQLHTQLGVRSSSGLETALICARADGKLGPEVPVRKDALRGGYDLAVDDSSTFTPGQVVQLSLSDPAVDARHPRAADSDLAAHFVAPYTITDDLDVYLSYGAKGRFVILLEVAAVPSSTVVRFTVPLRTDILTKWRPKLQSIEMLHEVGIESMRLSSAWLGGFSHHKPFPHTAKGDYVTGGPGIIRTAQEQDYSWSGIAYERVAHGWIRDVTTVNYTQDFTLAFCKNISVLQPRIEGQAGHCAVTLSRAFDCLVAGTEIVAPRVHTFFVSGFAAGNVFTQANFRYGPYDPVSDTDTCLDFHGLAPYENLYDSIDRAYVYPGGAYAYLPHAGQRNVFWNIRTPEQMLRGGDSPEFFRTYAKTSSRGKNTAYEHWPHAFVIGVYRDTAPITIGGHSDDRADAWLTVQGLNRPGVEPASLYTAQRLRIYPLPAKRP